MEILKAKVTKDSTLTATYRDETGTVTIEGKNLVTSDLLNSFSQLVSHMAFLCEQKEADGKEFLEDLPDNIDKVLEVTGYSIGGDGDNKGVTLTGKRFLKTNKVLNLNSPFTKFEDDNEPYQFAFKLEQAISTCEYEVNEYIFNKKWKVVQQELPFDDGKTEVEIHAEAVPESEIPIPRNADMESFQTAMNNPSVTIKNIKSRSSRRVSSKQLAS